MSKQLNFQYNGINYTLEYTRKSVEQMEREGFVAEDIQTTSRSFRLLVCSWAAVSFRALWAD